MQIYDAAANQLTPEIRTETFTSVRRALTDAENFDLFIFDGAPHATIATRDMALDIYAWRRAAGTLESRSFA